MGDKKHIDRLFQEHFKDFEVKPDDTVWENIEAKLNKKKKKRRVIPIWRRYAGVAALLALLLSIGAMYYSNAEQTTTPEVVDTQVEDIEHTIDVNHEGENSSIAKDQNTSIATTTDDKDENDKTKDQESSNGINDANVNQFIDTSDAIANANTSSTNSTEIIEKVSNSTKKQNQSEDKFNKNGVEQIAENNRTTSEENKDKANSALKTKVNGIGDDSYNEVKNSKTVITDNSNSKENNNTSNNASITIAKNKLDEKATESIEEAVAKNESLLENENTKLANNKWSVTPNAAPVYFNSLGKGSSIGEQFNDNNKRGEVNMSYGINASYAISNRLTVRSGINRVNLGYNTNDVVAFGSVSGSARPTTLAALSGNFVESTADNVLDVNGDVTIMSATTFKSRNIDVLKSTSTSINQSFGFIEVPLELQYALSRKRFGVNVIGGFSSLFLNDYEAVSFVEGERTSVQNNDNINNTSYSANFGLGLSYKMSNKINLNLEPMFKYQINTFKNTTGDFQPFFIGVYTGFGIKF